jgi:hypothetical protein
MVGITTQAPQRRFSQHEKHARQATHYNLRVSEFLRAHQALDIWKAERWRVMACFADWDSACVWEQQQITEYGTEDDGGLLFNIAAGGNRIEAASVKGRAIRIAAIRAANMHPEARHDKSVAIKASWTQPEKRAKRIAGMLAVWERPGYRAKRGAATRKALARPEVRAKKSAAMREIMARPEVYAKRVAVLKRPEVRAKANAAVSKVNKSPVGRARASYAATLGHRRRRYGKPGPGQGSLF